MWALCQSVSCSCSSAVQQTIPNAWELTLTKFYMLLTVLWDSSTGSSQAWSMTPILTIGLSRRDVYLEHGVSQQKNMRPGSQHGQTSSCLCSEIAYCCLLSTILLLPPVCPRGCHIAQRQEVECKSWSSTTSQFLQLIWRVRLVTVQGQDIGQNYYLPWTWTQFYKLIVQQRWFLSHKWWNLS